VDPDFNIGSFEEDISPCERWAVTNVYFFAEFHSPRQSTLPDVRTELTIHLLSLGAAMAIEKRKGMTSSNRPPRLIPTELFWVEVYPRTFWGTKKGPKLTGDNVSEMCTLPKSCVGGVAALGFLFLAEMNEKETDLHQRMTEAVSLHQEVAWLEIKTCKSAGIARKTLVK
jgi:hypothetical protein